MKRLLTWLALSAILAPWVNAETFTAGGETYTYTVKTTQNLNSGTVHKRLRFTSPASLNVNIVEVDLTDPNVRVETTQGSDKMFTAQTLVNRFNALKNAGRKPLVIQNASFWSMSNQANVTDAGKYAAQTCLGGFMQNGKLVSESNCAFDSWVGGPTLHGVFAIGNKQAYAGNYATNMRLMCPTRWGSSETANILQPTEANKYCHYGTIAVFTQMFPSTRTIQVIDARNGQGSSSSAMTSCDATYVFLKLKSGHTEGYNKWIEYEVKQITPNCASATRGSYDMVVVFAIGSHAAVSALQVGDTMKFKYMWHPADQINNVSAMTPLLDLENLVAGHQVVMKNGVVQNPDSYGSTVYSRSAYGVSQNGKKMYMCIIDKSTDATYGTSSGCNTKRLSYIMKHFGAYNVVSCDAGGSAQMVVNGAQAGTPSDSRGIVGSVVVFDVGSGNTGGGVEQGEDTPTPSSSQITNNKTAVTPGSGNANPYAYALSGSVASGMLTVNYKLNAAATSVKLNLISNGRTEKTVDLTGKSAGAHSQSVSIGGLASGDYTWEIVVDGAAKSSIECFNSAYSFYHPQGVDVVRNQNSDYYGTILVTEGQAHADSSTKKYLQNNGGAGQGLYMFTPDMNPITNPITGNYAFRGGIPTYAVAVNGLANQGSVPRKVRVADDGRIFLTTASSTCSPLYVIPDLGDIVKNNGVFWQMTGGPINKSDICTWTDDNGNFSSAVNIGLAVKGSGANTVVALMGGNKNLINSGLASGVTCNTYNVGTSNTWGGRVPSSTVSGINAKYKVNTQNANLNYDNRGNLWVTQYQSSPSTSLPSIFCVNASGTELLKDASFVLGGGAFRFNPDFTQVAMSSSATTTSIYDITWGSDNKPYLTEKYRITHGMGTNVTDYAWDSNNNLYAVSRSQEIMKCWAIPRIDNTAVTAAQAKYGFTIEAAIEDPVVNVTPSNGKANPYAYNMTGIIGNGALSIGYSLNDDARAVHIAVYKFDNRSSSKKKAASYGDDDSMTLTKVVTLGASERTKGEHIVNLPIEGLVNGHYTWEILVEGDPNKTIEKFAEYKFMYPQGVEVITDPANAYYGHILVTESRPSTDATHFSTAGGGQGIYVFDPQVNPVKNPITNLYAFNGGLDGNYAFSTYSGGAPRKIRFSQDGRLFIGYAADNKSPLYYTDVEEMIGHNGDFSPLLIGSYNDNLEYVNSGNSVIGYANIGLALRGYGDNLVLATIGGNKSFWAFNQRYSKVDTYPIGTFAQWDQPATNLANASGFFVSNTSVNAEYDSRGGLWCVQHRSAPTEAVPSIKYVDASGNVKYSDATTVIGGGGFRFNRDFSQLAFSDSPGHIGIYEVTYDANGVPSLAKRYDITHTLGTNINDLAWDNANNLYAVSNSNKTFQAFSVPTASKIALSSTPATNYSFNVIDSTPTGVDNIEAEGNNPGSKWSVYSTPGTIVISGEANNIQVHDLNGKLISKNRRSIRAKKGVYIVTVDGSSIKLAVM